MKQLSKLYLKMPSNTHEKFDMNTGEISELIQTIVVNEEAWFKLYVESFFDAISKISSLKELQLFILCLKISVDREENGNIVNIMDIQFKNSVENEIKLNKQNLSRALSSLCTKKFLQKLDSHNYRINPLIAYCGSRHNKARLITKIIYNR